MWFPHIAINFVFVLGMVILYFLAIRFKWCATVCKSFGFYSGKWCVLCKAVICYYFHLEIRGKQCIIDSYWSYTLNCDVYDGNLIRSNGLTRRLFRRLSVEREGQRDRQAICL